MATSSRHVMHIRNIPCKILEEEFMDVMRDLGLHAPRYALHFPKRRRRQGRLNNLGYGFASCSLAEDAEAFARAMHGFRFDNVASKKQLVIEQWHHTSAIESSWWWSVGQPNTHYALQAVTQANDDDGFEVMQSYEAAWGQPDAREALQAWTPSSDDVGVDVMQSYAASSNEADSMSSPERNPTFSIRSASRSPDACEVPPTRLARSLAHLANESSDAWVNESAPIFFRFQ
eukprot:TRINITY_DN9865_c0_g1_i6.p1 TRINITY_DN9865_c0_g1~~TRINITY_DN9865_c0_g1_i6.p1  ORF type:complete len:250 (-),score=29.70 TRINITY_DN9865_c0_g1_i6:328-1020(-)